MKYWKVLLLLLACYNPITFSQTIPPGILKDWRILVKNERLFDQFYKCIFDRGSCSRQGENMKTILSEYFANECSKCSEELKVHLEEIFTYMKTEKPEVWDEIQEKYVKKKRISLLESILGSLTIEEE